MQSKYQEILSRKEAYTNLLRMFENAQERTKQNTKLPVNITIENGNISTFIPTFSDENIIYRQLRKTVYKIFDENDAKATGEKHHEGDVMEIFAKFNCKDSYKIADEIAKRMQNERIISAFGLRIAPSLLREY